MISEQLLKDTLSKSGLPVKKFTYRGKEPVYIVYNEEDERGVLHGDDMPQQMSVWWQVHLFAPEKYNYADMKRKLRNYLLAAGFLLEDIATLFEKETSTVHVVISCSIEEDMEE